MKKTINLAELPQSLNSHAVVAGGLLYTSGQLGKDPKSGEMLEGIEAQTRQALENLKILLTAAGITLDDVVKVNVYISNFEDMKAANKVYYEEYFRENRPARTGICVAKFPEGVLIEMDAVAVMK